MNTNLIAMFLIRTGRQILRFHQLRGAYVTVPTRCVSFHASTGTAYGLFSNFGSLKHIVTRGCASLDGLKTDSSKQNEPIAKKQSPVVEEGEKRNGKLHGKGKRTYENGEVLEGEFRDGSIYNGNGILYHYRGLVEKGFWRSAHLHGQCTRTYPNGTTFSGYFVRGALDGQGVITFPDGQRWEGEWRKGKICNGKGVFRYSNGSEERGVWTEGNLIGKRTFPDGGQQEGTFRNKALHGQGVVTRPDGHRLEGEFRDGKIHNGKGMVRYPSGEIEEGVWVDGLLTGEGKRTLNNGTVYSGTFVQGKVAQGVVTYLDGHRLEGEFREGKIYNGKGTLRLPKGDIEEGEWVNGCLTGEGKRTLANGTVYSGTFVKDNLVRGTVAYADGRRCDGEWRKGKIYRGKGTFCNAAGIIEEGEWVLGRLTGEGKRTFSDGTVYAGTFNYGRLHGQGVVTHPDGHRLEGVFREGKIYNGVGALRHPSGDIEEGTWVEGQFTGKGKRT